MKSTKSCTQCYYDLLRHITWRFAFLIFESTSISVLVMVRQIHNKQRVSISTLSTSTWYSTLFCLTHNPYNIALGTYFIAHVPYLVIFVFYWWNSYNSFHLILIPHIVADKIQYMYPYELSSTSKVITFKQGVRKTKNNNSRCSFLDLKGLCLEDHLTQSFFVFCPRLAIALIEY